MALPLVVCCGVWQKDSGGESFGCCGTSVDQTSSSSASRGCSPGLRSGVFGGQVGGLCGVLLYTGCSGAFLLRPALIYFIFLPACAAVDFL